MKKQKNNLIWEEYKGELISAVVLAIGALVFGFYKYALYGIIVVIFFILTPVLIYFLMKLFAFIQDKLKK